METGLMVSAGYFCAFRTAEYVPSDISIKNAGITIVPPPPPTQYAHCEG
jgi:hypothetical protein